MIDKSTKHIIATKNKKITDLNNKVADLQRLCERALLCLSEHWDDLTDENGYGYSSLESALKKAASGKEYKELRLFTDKLIKINQDMERELIKYEKAQDEPETQK